MQGRAFPAAKLVNAMLTPIGDCYGWGTLGGFEMPHSLRDRAAPYQAIANVLVEVGAADGVRREDRLRLFEAVAALEAWGAPEAEVALAWRLTRAVHAFEFAMIHSAAPDRIYVRKALKRAQEAWTKHLSSPNAGAWEARPRDLAA